LGSASSNVPSAASTASLRRQPLGARHRVAGIGLLIQFLKDRLQRFGVEDAGGFGKTAQRRAAHAQFARHRLVIAGALDVAQAGQRRREKVKQQQADVVVVHQLAVGMRSLSAQAFQQLADGIEEFQAPDVPGAKHRLRGIGAHA